MQKNYTFVLSPTVIALMAALAAAPSAAQQQPPGLSQPETERLLPKGGQAPGDKKLTEKDVPRAKPRTPLEAALKDGFPANAVKRRDVRENLYALLATAADKNEAKAVSQALNQLYLTSGSPTVDLLMKRGIKSINGKKLDLALEFLNAVIELAPDYAEGWNRRAYIYYKQNKYHQAAGDLRRVLALDPHHFKALDGLGTILRETGDETGALKVFERLTDVHPHWSGADSVLKELKQKVEGRGI
ncbi:MAG: tetratricopeptide repeat protein [Hyphomicrobiaceae bacterium]